MPQSDLVFVPSANTLGRPYNINVKHSELTSWTCWDTGVSLHWGGTGPALAKTESIYIDLHLATSFYAKFHTNLTKHCDMSKNVSLWHHTLQGVAEYHALGNGLMLQCTWETSLTLALSNVCSNQWRLEDSCMQTCVRAVSSNMFNHKFKGSGFSQAISATGSFLGQAQSVLASCLSAPATATYSHNWEGSIHDATYLLFQAYQGLIWNHTSAGVSAWQVDWNLALVHWWSLWYKYV